jgi:hypothetical protein
MSLKLSVAEIKFEEEETFSFVDWSLKRHNLERVGISSSFRMQRRRGAYWQMVDAPCRSDARTYSGRSGEAARQHAVSLDRRVRAASAVFIRIQATR